MSGFLDAFAALAQRSGGNVFCVGEMRGDCVPQLKTLKVNNPCQDVYSVAKAFTVTAVGLLTDRDLLSVQETITDVLKEQLPAGCAPVWYSTTLDMLLRHQVTLPEGFLDIDGWDANEFGEDYLAYTLQYPVPADMAPRYCYTDAAFYLLSRAVEARAGMPLDTFLWKELFFPLGCREAAWSRCPQGHAMGATGLYIRVEDMLKLGRLYLDGGIWQGRRILSQQWVDTVRSRGYELNPVGVGDAFGKGGMRGQILIIIPQQDRVAAWQSCEDTCSADYVRFAAQYRDEAPAEELR